MCIILCLCPHLQMNAVRGGTVTWRPQPWQDGDGGGGEPLSDSDSEEEDFPDDSTTPLGDYITHGGTLENDKAGVSLFLHYIGLILPSVATLSFLPPLSSLSFRTEATPGCSAAV